MKKEDLRAEKKAVKEKFQEDKKKEKAKVSNYESELKNTIKKKVEAKYEAKEAEAASKKVKMVAQLGEELKSEPVKRAIAKRVAVKMKKKASENVYTVDQARELEKVVLMKETNRVRNKLWEKEEAHEKAKAVSKGRETTDDEVPESEEGVFLDKKKISKMKAAAAAETIPAVDKEQQRRISDAMKEEDSRMRAERLDKLAAAKRHRSRYQQEKATRVHELVQKVEDEESQKEQLDVEKKQVLEEELPPGIPMPDASI